MKLFVKKALLLCLLLLVAILGLNYLGVKAGSIFKDRAAMVCEKKREQIYSGVVRYSPDRVNVLFMGNSKIMSGIVPKRFDELSGGKTYSYNMAFPALNIDASYYALLEYLMRNPPPQYIVIALEISRCKDCAMYNYYAAQGVNRVDEMVSRLQYFHSKSVVLNYLFPIRIYKYFIPQYAVYAFRKPSLLKETKNYNRFTLDQMTEDRGYYYIQEQAITAGNEMPEQMIAKPGKRGKKPIEYDPFAESLYVDMFFELAQKCNIKVILIQPAHRLNQYLQYENIPQQYKSVMDRYSNVFIAKNGWKLKFYDFKWFSDPTHLSKEGALKYTKEIYTEIVSIESLNFPGNVCKK